MAAPFVSGVVAHMLNHHPDASVGKVREALQISAIHPGSASYDHEYGHGIVDPDGAVSALASVIPGSADPVDEFVAVSAGAGHSCGLAANGRVRCWGVSDVVDATPEFEFDSLSSAPEGDFVCGVRRGDGAVQCWGDLPGGLAPVAGARIFDEGKFAGVAVGGSHVCARRPGDASVDLGSRGRVVCWGDSTGGRTAVPDDVFRHFGTDHVPFLEIVAGTDHSCGRTVASGLVCWGLDDSGQQSSDPVGIYGPVAAGGAHTCAVVHLVGVSCWGDDGDGRLDAPFGEFSQVSAGRAHTCAIAVDGGAVTCWGDSTSGQSDAPAGEFTAVAAGDDHSCGVRAGGRLECWGDDSMGQAPQARLESLSLTGSGGVDLLDGVLDPEVTGYTVLAPSGVVTLGWAVADDASSRPRVSGLPTDVAAGVPGLQLRLAAGESVAVTVDALFGFGVSRTYTISAVGRPRLSALGVRPERSGSDCVPACAELALSPAFDPEVFAYSVAVPEDLARLTVSVLASGGAAVVAPGDADSTVGGRQVALNTNRDFVAVSAGGNFSCGLKTAGAVECWGEDDYGQLAAPSGVFSAVSAGTRHACAIGSAGAVSCWGWDADGQGLATGGRLQRGQRRRVPHLCCVGELHCGLLGL